MHHESFRRQNMTEKMCLGCHIPRTVAGWTAISEPLEETGTLGSYILQLLCRRGCQIMVATRKHQYKTSNGRCRSGPIDSFDNANAKYEREKVEPG